MLTGRKHRFAIGAVLVLAACSRGGDEDPAAVLERAAAKAQQVRSASFDATIAYSSPALSADGSVEGTMADGGKRMAFRFDADVTTREEGADKTVSTEGDVVVAGENEAYVKLSRLDGSVLFLPGVGLVPDTALGRWFLAGSTASGAVDVTPDPSFVAQQARTLAVTDDRSYEEVDGHRCYVYDVTVDHAKAVEFLAETANRQGKPFDKEAAETFVSSYDARGTVYIDAETSVIRRIDWTIDPAPGQENGAGVVLRLHMSKHDEPVEISPPAEYAPLSELFTDVPLPAL
jgi:hypothetical protein